MKLFINLLLSTAVAISMAACSSEAAHDHAHDHGHAHGHAHDHAEHADDGTIHLEPAMAERFGVTVAKAETTPVGAVVKVGGTIEASTEAQGVITATTSGIITLNSGINVGSEVGTGTSIGRIKADNVSGGDANRAAQAALNAAQAEYDRIKPLWEERLVTQAQYNAAVAELERARAAFSSSAATGRATSPIAGVITSLAVQTGQYVEVGAPIATVAALKNLTLTAQLPARHSSILADFADARVVDSQTGRTAMISELKGRRLNANVSAGAAGYVPVVFTFANDGRWVPGTAVEVYLMGNSTRQALTVPQSALCEQQGSYFVFIRLDEDCYLKQPVTIGVSDGQRVEILAGLKGGEDVVATGVTTVRLAENSGAIPEGHSHSH